MDPQQQFEEQDLWAEVSSATKVKLFEPLESVPGRGRGVPAQEESPVPGDTVPRESPCPISADRGEMLHPGDLGLHRVCGSSGSLEECRTINRSCARLITSAPSFPSSTLHLRLCSALILRKGRSSQAALPTQNGPVPQENLPLVLAQKHNKCLGINLGQPFLLKPSTAPRNK